MAIRSSGSSILTFSCMPTSFPALLLLIILLTMPTSSSSSSSAAAAAARTGALSNTRRRSYSILEAPPGFIRWPSGSLVTYAFEDLSFSTSPSSPAPSSDSSAAVSSSSSSTPSPLIGVSISQIQKAVHDAFDAWSSFVPYTFQQVDPLMDPLIVFGFIPLQPNRLGVMYPVWNPLDVQPYRSQIFFSSNTTWWADPIDEDEHPHRHRRFPILHLHLHRHHHSRDWYDLQNVAMHEIGHALGLDHSAVRTAIMYFKSKKGEIAHTLQPDDIAGAQAIYGGASPLPLPPPSSGAAATTGSSMSILLLLFVTTTLFISALGLAR